MKRPKGGKVSFAGFSLVMAVAVLLLQIGTASPGAPDVCEEPCNEESEGAQLPATPATGSHQTVRDQEVEPGSLESEDTEVQRSVLRGTTAAMVPAEPQLLPTLMRVPAPRGGIPVVRGALDYRAPLVVRQRVPARIVGGVYMPAHETYVVLQPGHWEFQGAVEDPAPAAVVEPTGEPETAKGCWLRRLFRKLGRCDGGS